MSWRSVVVTGIAKLDYKLDFLVIRKKEQTVQVFLDEVGVLIIESTAVSITTALLCELIKKKIKVIFCDEKHNPISELMPYYGSHDTSAKKSLYGEIEKSFIEQGVENELLTMAQSLLDKLDDLSMYLDYVIDYTDAISLADVLKLASVSIRKIDGTFTERFIEFADILEQFSSVRLFILANCKSVIEDEEIKHIEKWAQYKGVYVLIVENSDFFDGSENNKYIMDRDYCLIH